MATHVALLRGINVGGNNKVPMADLREVVASLGHTGVSTYIQSGNVLFTAQEGAAAAALAAGLEQAIEQAFGLRLRVVVLSRAELAQVISDNPYQAEPNPKYVHAMFFPAEPGPEVRESVTAAERQAAAVRRRAPGDTPGDAGRGRPRDGGPPGAGAAGGPPPPLYPPRSARRGPPVPVSWRSKKGRPPPNLGPPPEPLDWRKDRGE